MWSPISSSAKLLNSEWTTDFDFGVFVLQIFQIFEKVEIMVNLFPAVRFTPIGVLGSGALPPRNLRTVPAVGPFTLYSNLSCYTLLYK